MRQPDSIFAKPGCLSISEKYLVYGFTASIVAETM